MLLKQKQMLNILDVQQRFKQSNCLDKKFVKLKKKLFYNEFADKKDDIITGIVDRVEDKFAIVNIGKTGAFLALNQTNSWRKIKRGTTFKSLCL